MIKMMLSKTITIGALLLAVVGTASASSVHSSMALRDEEDVNPISKLRSMITTKRELAAIKKKKTLKKKKAVEAPFGNAFGKSKQEEMSPSCDNALSLEVKAVLENTEAALDVFYLLFTATIVFFTQAGFAMLCAGSVRQKNVQNIMLMNILDACGGAVGFWLVGYAFAYGGRLDASKKGFIGNQVAETTPRSVTSLQVLGTFILWVGWYGFNPGSTLINVDTSPSFLAGVLWIIGWVRNDTSAMDTCKAGIEHTAGGITALMAGIEAEEGPNQKNPLSELDGITAGSMWGVTVKENTDEVSVVYTVDLCKDDGSAFDEEEADHVIDVMTEQIDGFMIGLKDSMELTGFVYPVVVYSIQFLD